MTDTIINAGNGTFKTEGAVGMKEVRDFLPGKDGLLASSFEVTDFPGSVSLKKLYDESSAGRIVLAGNASYPSENYSRIGFRGSSYRNPTISYELNGGQELFTITISAQNTESTDTWEYKIDEGSWTQGGTIATTTKTVTNVSSGTYSIEVRLKDSQGTVIATSIQKSVSVSSPPTIALAGINQQALLDGQVVYTEWLAQPGVGGRYSSVHLILHPSRYAGQTVEGPSAINLAIRGTYNASLDRFTVGDPSYGLPFGYGLKFFPNTGYGSKVEGAGFGYTSTFSAIYWGNPNNPLDVDDLTDYTNSDVRWGGYDNPTYPANSFRLKWLRKKAGLPNIVSLSNYYGLTKLHDIPSQGFQPYFSGGGGLPASSPWFFI